MKPIIYYFTSTGNSQHIAKIIQNKLDGELVPMRGNMGVTCPNAIIGFVFPTYFWGIPHLVREFITTIKITVKNPYIFAITSCGQASGGALGMVNEILAEHHLRLNYGSSIRSVSNYIVQYDIRQNSIEKTLAAAKLKAEQAAKDISAQKNRRIRPPFFIDRLFYKIYLRRSWQDTKFSVDDICNGCGICQNICPAANIALQTGKPVFQHHCEHCLACVHWCPQKAIQFGSGTKNRKRYHNPNISMQELNK